MAQKTDRTFLLKISDGAGGFDAFAGIKSKSLKINNGRTDATLPDKDDPGGTLWAASLDDVKSISFSGDGRLVKEDEEARLVAAAMSQEATEDFQVVVPNVGSFEGNFSIEVELGGDGGVTFSISAESNGKITFTAERKRWGGYESTAGWAG